MSNRYAQALNPILARTGFAAGALILAGCLLSRDPEKTDTAVVPKDTTAISQKPVTGDTTAKKEPLKQPPPPRIRPEMIRIAGAAKVLLKGSSARSASPSEPHWSSAFTLTSFRTPIRGIYLTDSLGNNGAQIYRCTTGDCMVDLASASAGDILRAAYMDIRPGTYSSIRFDYCAERAGGYSSEVTGSVTLNDTVWHTRAGSSMSKQGPATAASIAYSGCGRVFSLPSPVVIPSAPGDTGRVVPADTGAVTGGGPSPAPMPFLEPDSAVADTAPVPGAPAEIRLRLFFDVENLVWAGLNEHAAAWAWAPGNCTGPHPDNAMDDTIPFICAGYPDVAGTTDSAAPLLERYYLNGSAVIGLFFSAQNGNFLGGYSRRYLAEGNARQPGFEPVTPVKAFRALEGGLHHLSIYGGGSRGENPYFQTDGFRRAAHSAAYTTDRSGAGTYDAATARP